VTPPPPTHVMAGEERLRARRPPPSPPQQPLTHVVAGVEPPRVSRPPPLPATWRAGPPARRSSWHPPSRAPEPLPPEPLPPEPPRHASCRQGDACVAALQWQQSTASVTAAARSSALAMYHALTRSFSATGRQEKLAQTVLVKLL
jgi:hypothetical protein